MASIVGYHFQVRGQRVECLLVRNPDGEVVESGCCLCLVRIQPESNGWAIGRMAHPDTHQQLAISELRCLAVPKSSPGPGLRPGQVADRKFQVTDSGEPDGLSIHEARTESHHV